MESFKSSQVADWTVYGIPAFNDNYLWAIVNGKTNSCIVVDPGCSSSVQSFIDAHGLNLSGILVTHHHPDHIGGVEALLKNNRSGIPVVGTASERISQVNQPVPGGEGFELLGLRFSVLEVPGHTIDHLAFVAWPNSSQAWLFCGDTLFAGGCGRLFEGTAEQMFESFQKIKELPDNTLVYCAHEYTESNYRFAAQFSPNDKNIQSRFQEVQEMRTQGISTIPTTLKDERLTNLFMKSKNAIEFKNIRDAKDRF